MDWTDYKDKVKNALDTFEFDENILDILRDSIKKDQKIFVAGNGGSAAIANHLVCDLSKGANKDWKCNPDRYKAISLASNIGYILAISNDECYEDVFRQQLINLAKAKDILILISSSGNSPNIISAAKYAKECGLIVIGLSGLKGGKLREIAHYNAYIKSDYYEVSEDIHGVFAHFLAVYLREE